jgi:lipopolysaccharide biosynthesis regulator YciM
MFALVLNQVLPADAAKKSVKKKGVSQEIITDFSNKINILTQKVYEKELFSPEDSKSLITLKLQLDEYMDNLPEATFAPLYFKIGNIYRLRGEERDAIVCYQTILENFSDTAYGPKAKDILTQMGIEIRLPAEADEDDFDEEI